MKPSEVREKGVAELTRLAVELAEEGFHLRLKAAAGQLPNTASLRKTRKDLARVKTILRQKTAAEGTT